MSTDPTAVDWSTHRTARSGATVFAYVESGAGTPLILHHGGESHKRQYAMFVPHLAAGIRAISYDQRDVGDAAPASGPYAVGDLADDCVALMDALDIEQAHVMGISFGGAIALHVGLRHPDRVASLIVGAAPDSFQRPNPFIERAMTMSPEDRSALMLDASLSPDAQQDEQMRATLHDLTTGRVTAPGSYRADAIRSHDLSLAELARITPRTLLVYGELDPLVPPEVGRVVHDALPDSHLVVVPGARHGLSFEFREELGTLVSDWVRGHPSAAR